MNEYQKLEPGDVIAAGDEVKVRGNWWPTGDAGRTIRRIGDLEYRCKVVVDMNIDPGVGYRLLERGEIIQSGDERWSVTRASWILTDSPGHFYRLGSIVPAYRRKVECNSSERSSGQPVTNPGPKPEYGWCLLNPGEVVAPGDRVAGWMNSLWKDAGCIGDTVYHGRYERRIEPGAGYQLLERGEVIIEGDDIFCGFTEEGWRPTSLASDTVTEGVFRRKIEAPKRNYRLLNVGEILKPTDEVFFPSLSDWVRTDFSGVVTVASLPIRREIDNYTGGPV